MYPYIFNIPSADASLKRGERKPPPCLVSQSGTSPRPPPSSGRSLLSQSGSYFSWPISGLAVRDHFGASDRPRLVTSLPSRITKRGGDTFGRLIIISQHRRDLAEGVMSGNLSPWPFSGTWTNSPAMPCGPGTSSPQSHAPLLLGRFICGLPRVFCRLCAAFFRPW